ncbi:MAG: molecular chaperone DnaJ [Polyangiaceae bacterium]|nr:molecular chaperone DnaJ [Polyangiaceae bacterium]
MRDPYEVLGVGRDATEAEVRAAFRRLGAEHHPDRRPGDADAAARFKELNAAYQTLSDPRRRAAWDRFGAKGVEAGFSATVDANLEGLFGDLLGRFGVRTGERGDLRRRLEIRFEEAVRGATRELTYEKTDLCTACRGDGAEPGSPVARCAACDGRGRVRFQQLPFPIAVERACSRCRGTGSLPARPCRSCSGSGLHTRAVTVEIEIPPGVESGSTRLVEGGGSRVRADRPAGDLEITIDVAPHPFFVRAGDDVRCAVPVTFACAALGGEIEIPTLEGKAKLRVPPATQPGTLLRLAGKGVPHRFRSGRGDQLVEVSVEIPTRLSERARALIEELGQELGEDVQPQQRTFLEKLRSWLG